MDETDATRDRVVGHEMVGSITGDALAIDGVEWCSACGTLVFVELGGGVVETLVPSKRSES
jgi:hypothetical protein